MWIYGEEIVLRGIEEKDNQMLLSLINDPNTEIMIGGSSWPVSETEQLNWYTHLQSSKESLRCIVALKDEPQKALGTVILSEINQKNGTGHIHIKMGNDGARGNGYGTDAVKTLVDYAFNELRLNCIYANILSYNDISIKMFEKCSFKCDGVLRSRVFKNGSFVDIYAYSIIKSDLD